MVEAPGLATSEAVGAEARPVAVATMVEAAPAIAAAKPAAPEAATTEASAMEAMAAETSAPETVAAARSAVAHVLDHGHCRRLRPGRGTDGHEDAQRRRKPKSASCDTLSGKLHHPRAPGTCGGFLPRRAGTAHPHASRTRTGSFVPLPQAPGRAIGASGRSRPHLRGPRNHVLAGISVMGLRRSLIPAVGYSGRSGQEGQGRCPWTPPKASLWNPILE